VVFPASMCAIIPIFLNLSRGKLRDIVVSFVVTGGLMLDSP